MLPKAIAKLCTPAAVYFWISMISIAIIFLQNLGNSGVYSVGLYSARFKNITVLFIAKILYVLLWTWILHKICKYGYKSISWFLVLFPYILFLIMIGSFLLMGK